MPQDWRNLSHDRFTNEPANNHQSGTRPKFLTSLEENPNMVSDSESLEKKRLCCRFSALTLPFITIRKFLGYLTIEPFAFLAILALYIEFPSIQDLIYTKICLQVVARHTNSTGRHNQALPIILSTAELPFSQKLTDLSRANPKEKIGNITNRSLDLTPITLNVKLSSEGRINQNQEASIHYVVATQNTDEQFICDRFNKSALSKEVIQEIVDYDSLFWLRYQLIICSLNVISSPYWGGISDKIGRIIPMNVPLVIAVISNLISLAYGLLISMNLHSLLDISWLYVGAALIGLSGGQAIVIVNSFSFISDNSSSEGRTKRVVLLESIIYLAHSFGFFITRNIWSIKIESNEHLWLNRHSIAFSTCILLNMIGILYSILRLRHHKFHRFLNNFEREQQESQSTNTLTASMYGGESRAESRIVSTETMGSTNTDRHRELTASTPDDLDGPVAQTDKRLSGWRNILTLEYYRETYLTAMKPRESRNIILLLLLCGFISAMSIVCLLSLLFIYLHMEPFNWDTKTYSWWNSITSITRGCALISLTVCMKFIKGWNVPDPLIAALGFLSKGIGLLMISIAQSSTLINWTLLALIMAEFTMPPIRSILSKLVVVEEIAKIYSCLAAAQTICFLLGNIIFYLAFSSLELQEFFRLSFLIVACFQFTAVIIMILVYSSIRGRMLIV